MNNVILHHHADETAWQTHDIHDLKKVITPMETETYSPVSHFDFASRILKYSAATVREATFMLTNDDQRMFGHFLLDDLWHDKAKTLILRNSHDRSVAAFVGGGSYTFLCTNLAAHAQYSIRVRHTGNPWERIMEQLPELFQQLQLDHKRAQIRFEKMSRTHLSLQAGESIIIEAARENRGIIPPSKVIEVANEWRYPTFDYEHIPHQSLGYLFEAFTSTALHGINPVRNTNKTLALNEMMDEVLEHV